MRLPAEHDAPDISVVILTYNRPGYANSLVDQLRSLSSFIRDIVVVDNHSEVPVEIDSRSPIAVKILRLPQNLGAAGRNVGIREAAGSIVLTLDDDVSPPTIEGLQALRGQFEKADVAAVCFKVLEDGTGKQINWCHRYDIEKCGDLEFLTNEISEGAVAFRKDAVIDAGLYPESFFISHEGPDLAFRLINRGFHIVYDPRIAVTHSTATGGRTSWRRYYYDTRNVFWLAARNYPFVFALKKVSIQVGAMLVYSVRDGYVRYWCRAVWDALVGMRQALKEREKPTPEAMQKMRQIDRNQPPLLTLLRRRLSQRTVRI